MTAAATLDEHGAVYRVTFARVVRSEWTKLRSLRSTWITLGAAVLLTVAMSGGFGYGYGQSVDAGATEATVAGAIDAAFIGLDLLSLVLGVMAALQMTGEYSSGMIRATFAAVPRRLPVLAAKALVLVAVLVPVILATCAAAFAVAQAFAGGHGVALGDQGAAGAVMRATGYPLAMALIGLGFGALLRHTAGAITTFVVVLLVGPALLPLMLSEYWQDTLMPYFPVVAGQSLYAEHDIGPFGSVSRGESALALAGWVLVVLAGGAALLRRRDA